MASVNPVTGGVNVTAPGVQLSPSPAQVLAAANQYAIELAWKQAHPNQAYARAHLGGTVGGE